MQNSTPPSSSTRSPLIGFIAVSITISLCFCIALLSLLGGYVFVFTDTGVFDDNPEIVSIRADDPTRIPLEFGSAFQVEDCPFSDWMEGVTCGYLEVLENHNDPSSKQIDIFVAIFHARDTRLYEDPLVYVAGGPGSSAVYQLEYTVETWKYSPLARYRDVIFMDQRGTGYSEPSLDCSEIDPLNWDHQEVSWGMWMSAALLTCRDRLESDGINLSNYTSSMIASDIEAMRIAFNLDQINLYGVSYGSRISLTMMRDYPESIRSVILDSVVPVQINIYEQYPLNAIHAFDKLFSACEADRDCNADYPDLREVFEETVIELDETPLELTIERPGDDSAYTLVFSAQQLTDFLFNALYKKDAIPFLPRVIYEIAERDFTTYTRVTGEEIQDIRELDLTSFNSANDGFSTGLFLSVICREEEPFYDQDVIDQIIEKDVPDYLQSVLYPNKIWECSHWQVDPPDLKENDAVESTIPTLILAGEFDPITPSHWADIAAETLDTAYVYFFPTVGHGVLSDHRCITALAADFIDDPLTKPENGCTDRLDTVNFR